MIASEISIIKNKEVLNELKFTIPMVYMHLGCNIITRERKL